MINLSLPTILHLNGYGKKLITTRVIAPSVLKMLLNTIRRLKRAEFDFLAGLNSEYDGIRIQILGNDPFPSLSEVYSYV